MSIWDAVLLGLIQGFTEFIPVSSTAHIVILAKVLGINTPGLGLEAFLHIPSLLAVIIYFHRDLLWLVKGSFVHLFVDKFAPSENRTPFLFSCYLGVATLITAVVALPLNKLLGDTIKTTPVIATCLMVTAILLIIVERLTALGKRKPEDLNVVDGLVVGTAQAIAFLPGISRSGATLIAGLFMKMDRPTAVKFAFLLAIPALAGATVLSIKDLVDGELAALGFSFLTISFIVSFIASVASILWLIKLLQKQRLYWFSIYLVILSICAVAFLD